MGAEIIRNVLDRTEAARQRLAGRFEVEDINTAIRLLEELKNAREFAAMTNLAEDVVRREPNHSPAVKLYAQGLIEVGKASLATAIIERTLSSVAEDDPEHAELCGLKGRAAKQIFMDSMDRTQAFALAALTDAIEAYAIPYRQDPSRTWHGINLSACLHAGGRHKLKVLNDLTSQSVASSVLETLIKTPDNERDCWWSATLAEAHIGLGQWEEAKEALVRYVHDDKVTPFQYASTLRQFRDVWAIEHDGEFGKALIQALEARLLGDVLEGGLRLDPEYVRDLIQSPEPTDANLEKVHGVTNAQTVRWYRTGLERATSVASVRMRFGSRFGTAFAVPAVAFELRSTAPVLALTNHHVINKTGEGGAALPSEIEFCFELAGEAAQVFPVAKVLAQSRVLDFCLIELDGDLSRLTAVPLARSLPRLNGKDRVYVIGHPRGDEMHIALQDNVLLDHEGPPAGQPEQPERLRVHYRAPTEGGSSGSPVFDRNWDVLALHHAGLLYDPDDPAKPGYPKLNGKEGRYGANQGYWIQSVVDDVKAQLGANTA